MAFKTSTAIFIIGVVLYLFGSNLFELFGFTLDAFRIGSGVLLMLTAVALMNDDGSAGHTKREGDISVVPLAIPLGMGPASIGAVMVMGASAVDPHEMLVGVFSLLLAAAGMFLLLCLADGVARVLRRTGIAVLSKLTGLLLAAHCGPGDLHGGQRVFEIGHFNFETRTLSKILCSKGFFRASRLAETVCFSGERELQV